MHIVIKLDLKEAERLVFNVTGLVCLGSVSHLIPVLMHNRLGYVLGYVHIDSFKGHS